MPAARRRRAATSDFDLAEIVLAHIKARKSPDPHEIASDVLKQIPEDELYGVVELLLPRYVNDMMRAHRSSAQKRKRSKKGKETTSARWARTEHEDWDEIFFASVNVPGTGRKFFGDCTRDDIAAIANDYFDAASENQAKGESYSEIFEAMKRRRVDLVSELPADLVREAFDTDEEDDENEEEAA